MVAFDYRTRNPKWVLEAITEQSSSGGADRCAPAGAAGRAPPAAIITETRVTGAALRDALGLAGNRKHMDFFEDKTIEEWLRSRLADYRGSGYDRGHMVSRVGWLTRQVHAVWGSPPRPTRPEARATPPPPPRGPAWRRLRRQTARARPRPWRRPLACATSAPRSGRASTGAVTTRPSRTHATCGCTAIPVCAAGASMPQGLLGPFRKVRAGPDAQQRARVGGDGAAVDAHAGRGRQVAHAARAHRCAWASTHHIEIMPGLPQQQPSPPPLW